MIINRPSRVLRGVEYPTWIRSLFLPLGDLIDTQGAANELDVSERAVRRWNALGLMPFQHKRGKRLLYRRSDIEIVKAEFRNIAVRLRNARP